MQGKKILVCDDEEGMLRYLRKMLELCGASVETCSDGRSIVHRIENGGADDVDLLLQDVHLPDMSGIDVLRRVKAARPHLPVVLMTACLSSESSRDAEEAGAAGVLSKPFPRERFLEVVRRNLSLAVGSSNHF